MKRMLVILSVLILAAVTLFACQSSYKVVTKADGTVQAEGKYDPKREAPSLGVAPGPTTLPSVTLTPLFRTATREELSSARANTLMILGAIVALVGVGLWVARAYLPIIPTTAGTYAVLAGGAMVTASFMLPSIPAWSWLVVLAIGLALILPGVWANWNAMNKPRVEGVSP